MAAVLLHCKGWAKVWGADITVVSPKHKTIELNYKNCYKWVLVTAQIPTVQSYTSSAYSGYRAFSFEYYVLVEGVWFHFYSFVQYKAVTGC